MRISYWSSDVCSSDLLPNSVDCGPRSTSIRCTLPRSPSDPAERERNTPSMNTPTEGSMPKLFAPLPKPRMMKVVLDELCSWLTRSEGETVCKSVRSRICPRSIVSPEVTETKIRSEEHTSELQSHIRPSNA